MSSATVPLDQISDLLKLRFDRTLEFINKSKFKPKKILDLGPNNTFAEILRNKGFQVVNTGVVDLDDQPEIVEKFDDIDCITSFEIFEHLVAPFNVLRKLPKVKMFVSVPLRLWFSPAFRNKNDKWDQHYHEFEDWQFKLLLRKTGWKVIDEKKFTNPVKKIGFRPLLRLFTNRYLIVYAEKIKG